MFRSLFPTMLLCLAPISYLWAQDDKQDPTVSIVSKSVVDPGLIHRESVQKTWPDSMPVLNPREYDAKIRLWSPSFEWFNSMPVIGDSGQKVDSLDYGRKPGSPQQESDQQK